VGVAAPARAKLQVQSMGNSNENGIFAPIVRKMASVVGKKPFNQFRGKGIALHSQVSTRAVSNGPGGGVRVGRRRRFACSEMGVYGTRHTYPTSGAAPTCYPSCEHRRVRSLS
jgi:hypothetical protein